MSIDFVYDQGIRQVFFIRVVSSSVPSKLSSISRMKAARGREGVCRHPPPADVLPAPGIQQTPTMLAFLTSPAVNQQKSCHLLNTAKGEFCVVSFSENLLPLPKTTSGLYDLCARLPSPPSARSTAHSRSS
ncbi:hypothetical protein OYC64_014644 [Pagothenia borchgrevinki]